VLIEPHCHTSEVSPCAEVPAAQAIRIHKAAGFDAVIITDHFNDYVLEAFPGSPKERVDRYLDGYRYAREEGEKLGLNVMFSLESRIVGGPEDFLVYGIGFDFVYEHPQFYSYTQEEAFKAVCEYGAIMLQAHPCRGYCRPRDPKFLHGVEIINGNPWHNNHNDRALDWALEHHLDIHTSGSDFHVAKDVGTGGMILEGTVHNSKEFAEYIRLHKPCKLLGK